jgi:hypothetical protein
MIKMDQHTWKNFNVLSITIVFEFFFLFIAYKVLHVPVTHDEAFTALQYNKYSYWQIMMYPDSYPNNHILNTLLTKFLVAVLGLKQWVIRLPNLLSFLVYAYAIIRINRSIFTRSSVFFLPASILFLCNPYLLDFFGLCRGYGLAVALCTLSLGFLISGFKASKTRDIWLAFFFAMLASYSNFTLLVYWLSVTVVVSIYFLLTFRKSGMILFRSAICLAVSCIGYALLIANPILKMQKGNVFIDWKTSGFYQDTMLSLVHNVWSESPTFSLPDYLLSIFLMIVVLGNMGYVFVKFYKSRFNTDCFRQPVFLSGIVLLVAVSLNVLQCALLKTPYLTGRTGLFYFPLFITALVSSIGLINSQKRVILKGIISITVSLLLFLQLAGSMRFDYVREWWYDSHTLYIIQYLNDSERDHVVSLKTNWIFNPSFTFYKYAGQMPNIILKEYDKNIDVNSDADYYYILKENFEFLKPRFEPVLEFGGRFMLVKAKQQ